MSCDLSSLFHELASDLRNASDGLFELSARTLIAVPADVETDLLVIEIGHHEYDSICRRDLLTFYASRATYQHLGLLIACVLFSRSPASMILTLTHPSSRVRRLILRRNDAVDTGTPGLHLEPLVLNYYSTSVGRHPWQSPPVSACDLPGFFLTNAEELVRTTDEWEKRDTVVGFGSDRGMSLLVELLLNAGQESSEALEFDLEGEGGFQGVAPFSSEVRLLLPGAFGWRDLVPAT